jgi:transcription antitermination factor NusG
MQNWLVIRTRPRWEKKVAQLLTAKGIEAFCPLYQASRRWSDRIKIIQQPVIPSCVFIKVSDSQWTTIRTTPGVLNFVISNCKPVVIKEKTVKSIRQFLEKYHSIEAIPTFKHASEPGAFVSKVTKLYIQGLNLFLIGHERAGLAVEVKDKSH